MPSCLPQQHIGHLPTWGAHLLESYLFIFSYCSWDSCSKNTRVVLFPPPAGRNLSELSTMTPPSCMALHGMAHSFIELHKPLRHDKAVIHEGEVALQSSPWRHRTFVSFQNIPLCPFPVIVTVNPWFRQTLIYFLSYIKFVVPRVFYKWNHNILLSASFCGQFSNSSMRFIHVAACITT